MDDCHLLFTRQWPIRGILPCFDSTLFRAIAWPVICEEHEIDTNEDAGCEYKKRAGKCLSKQATEHAR